MSNVEKLLILILIKFVSSVFLNEKERGAVFVFFDKGYDKERGHHDNINYYCPLCEEVHPREALCKECFEKQIGRNEFKRVFFRFIFPSLIFGVIIGFLIG